MVAKQAVTSSEGGKRLRALLTLDSFRAFASEDVRERDFDALLDLACAVEVFQTGALVHDDIIDDSDLRRGKPSAHRAFSTGTHSEAIGHGLGIMLGDMLATASVDIADKAASKLTHGSDVVAALLNMHREVEVGQVLDLAVELNPLDDPDELVEASLNVFRWKTASYTTIAPLEFGMLAAGIGKDDARKQALGSRLASWIGLPACRRSSGCCRFEQQYGQARWRRYPRRQAHGASSRRHQRGERHAAARAHRHVGGRFAFRNSSKTRH